MSTSSPFSPSGGNYTLQSSPSPSPPSASNSTIPRTPIDSYSDDDNSLASPSFNVYPDMTSSPGEGIVVKRNAFVGSVIPAGSSTSNNSTPSSSSSNNRKSSSSSSTSTEITPPRNHNHQHHATIDEEDNNNDNDNDTSSDSNNNSPPQSCDRIRDRDTDDHNTPNINSLRRNTNDDMLMDEVKLDHHHNTTNDPLTPTLKFHQPSASPSPIPHAYSSIPCATPTPGQISSLLSSTSPPKSSAHHHQGPEWEWSKSGMRRYIRFWYLTAKVYTLDRLSPRRIRKEWKVRHTHILIQVIYAILTFLLFFLLFYYHAFASHVPGYGQPLDLTCGAVAWNACGLNGGDCQPFDDKQWQALRCPGRCKLFETSGTVIGGGVNASGIYKADSRVCNSAIHAGLINDFTGGCILYRPAGVQISFPSGGLRNGILSGPFLSWFPGSMQLISAPGAQYCSGFGIGIIIIAIFWFIPLTLIKPHAMLMWYLLLFFGYWYVALTLNDHSTPRTLFWGGTLNCMLIAFIGYVMYHVAVKHTMYVNHTYEKESLQEIPWKWCMRYFERRKERKRKESGSIAVERAQKQRDASTRHRHHSIDVGNPNDSSLGGGGTGGSHSGGIPHALLAATSEQRPRGPSVSAEMSESPTVRPSLTGQHHHNPKSSISSSPGSTAGGGVGLEPLDLTQIGVLQSTPLTTTGSTSPTIVITDADQDRGSISTSTNSNTSKSGGGGGGEQRGSTSSLLPTSMRGNSTTSNTIASGVTHSSHPPPPLTDLSTHLMSSPPAPGYTPSPSPSPADHPYDASSSPPAMSSDYHPPRSWSMIEVRQRGNGGSMGGGSAGEGKTVPSGVSGTTYAAAVGRKDSTSLNNSNGGAGNSTSISQDVVVSSFIPSTIPALLSSSPCASPTPEPIVLHPSQHQLLLQQHLQLQKQHRDSGASDIITNTHKELDELILRPWYDLYFLYTLPLFITLHFSYLIYIPSVTDIDLDAKFFQQDMKGIMLILVFIIMLVMTLIYTIRLAFKENLFFRYLLYYSYLIGGIMFISLLFPDSSSFHLHHVLAGMILLPMTRFTSRVSLTFQAIATAIFLNGFGMWNLTGAWDLVRSPSIYTANPYNIEPQVIQLHNASSTSAVVAWPLYSNKSDVIGYSLFLNDIEIFHSSYNTLYGGGDLFNTTKWWNRGPPATAPTKVVIPPQQQMVYSRNGELQTMVLPHDDDGEQQQQMFILENHLPEVALPWQSSHSHKQEAKFYSDSFSDSSTLSSSHSTINTPPIRPAHLPPPLHPHIHAHHFSTAPRLSQLLVARESSIVHHTLREQNAHHAIRLARMMDEREMDTNEKVEDDQAASGLAATRSSSRMTSSSSSLLTSNNHTAPWNLNISSLFLFNLTNLLPATYYAVQVGYQLPGGYYNYGGTIVFRTNKTG